MSSRWARAALCALAVAAAVLIPREAAGATTSSKSHSKAAPSQAAPALTVISQTSFVTPTQPWFNVELGVNPDVGAAAGLHVALTFYERLAASSQFDQSVAGTPDGNTIGHESDVPVTATGSSLTATTCVVVVPNSEASPPTTGTGACPADSGVLYLGCEPDTGVCGDVYPVSVALYRNGDGTPVDRFTTFLTYQEPDNDGLPLDVGVIVPVGAKGVVAMAAALSAHHTTPTTLAVRPTAVAHAQATRSKGTLHALAELAALDSDQLLDQSFVPVNVASLSEAGLADEIGLQVNRGDNILRSAGLKPSGGPWVDTASSFTQGDGENLASGVQIAGSDKLVLNDSDLSPSGDSNYTYAQPFTLELGHGATVPAVASNASLSARFTAQPNDPVLGAEQLLAGLSFVHFENAFLVSRRGIVVEPPDHWQPSAPFIDTLLSGLTANPALQPVTVDQLFTQVPSGANDEPATRHLQDGPASRGIGSVSAARIALYRQQLTAYQESTGDPPQLGALADGLLATESRSLTTLKRTAALNVYARAFEAQTGRITLSTERTVTFTSRRAAIPVTVLSTEPYPVNVVVSLASDKFTFPNGSNVSVRLDRPTTSIRVVAQARGSGDRLPIDVTVRTADGQFVIARSVLTVHSTAISFVGVALTILAGAVLLVWWARTWRRSRRQRPRAAH